MVYRENFVVVVRDSEGKVLRESSNKEVFLPFNSEYSLRLKNNNQRKAVAEVYIDGTNVLGSNRIIIDSKSDVDLDRFCLDGDLNKGNKFKFVRIDNPNVQDPSSKENGIVKVRFWLEKQIEYSPILRTTWTQSFDPWIHRSGDFWYNSVEPTVYCSSVANLFQNVSSSPQEIGATVEGSKSNQSFSYSNVGELEENYTEIYLKIVPFKESLTVEKTKFKFCTECGKKLKMNDKFCSFCGKKQF